MCRKVDFNSYFAFNIKKYLWVGEKANSSTRKKNQSTFRLLCESNIARK
jgi:hypothetical protein